MIRKSTCAASVLVLGLGVIAPVLTWSRPTLGTACDLRCIGLTCYKGVSGTCYSFAFTQSVNIRSPTGSTTATLINDPSGGKVTLTQAGSCSADCDTLASSATSCAGPYQNPADYDRKVCAEPTPPGGT